MTKVNITPSNGELWVNLYDEDDKLIETLSVTVEKRVDGKWFMNVQSNRLDWTETQSR